MNACGGDILKPPNSSMPTERKMQGSDKCDAWLRVSLYLLLNDRRTTSLIFGQVGSVGLNLACANVVVILEPSLNPSGK